MANLPNKKTALVHDWYVGYAGGEKVCEQVLDLYPDADIFSLVDFLQGEQRNMVHGKPVETSFIQRMPFAKTRYRSYLPLMPLAIEQFDLSDYELVLSSSAAISKGVITGADQLHICYCHSPMRYAWELQHQYLDESGLSRGLKSMLARYFLHKLRIWDVRTANGVDHFIANSNFIARRIHKVYRREATVIHPPVDTQRYSLSEDKDDYYVAASRLVPYKRIDLIVKAFARMPGRRLVVIGDGPDMEKIRRLASPNVEVLGYLEGEELVKYLQEARAFVFAALEDFGIMPVEAQACGTPVIAYGRGGVLDSVLDNKTGVFFQSQTEESLIEAVERFEKLEFDAAEIREHAEKFSKDTFKLKFGGFVDDKFGQFQNKVV